MQWTEQDLDNLMTEVTETLEKAEALSKSAISKADDDKKDDEAAAAPAQDAPPAAATASADAGQSAAPAADAAQAPADQGAPADAAAADASAAPAADGDQALEAEGQQQDAPLSDEELSQIYSSMAPEELERHYSIIRQALQSAYSQDQGQAAAAPAAPAPDAQAAAPAAPGMEKSEAITALESKVAELTAANEQIVKVFEVLTKPARKSITEIQVMQKSEGDSPSANEPMTLEQTKEAARKLSPAKLEKGERELVNKLFLTGEGHKEVEKLIHSKGGK